jgi:uncharacterized protein
LETKIVRTEIKAAKDDMSFEGYASIFGNIDSWYDIVEKGAFKKTIKEHFKRIKVLAMHNVHSLIGKPVTLVEDSKGLYFEARVSDTSLGRDVMTLIKDKVLTEMSIGYDAVKFGFDEINGEKIRRLQEVRLWEISPVTWAANEQAAIKRLDFSTTYDNIKAEIKRLEALKVKAAEFSTLDLKPLINNNLDEPDINALIETIKNIKK